MLRFILRVIVLSLRVHHLFYITSLIYQSQIIKRVNNRFNALFFVTYYKYLYVLVIHVCTLQYLNNFITWWNMAIHNSNIWHICAKITDYREIWSLNQLMQTMRTKDLYLIQCSAKSTDSLDHIFSDNVLRLQFPSHSVDFSHYIHFSVFISCWYIRLHLFKEKQLVN